MKKLILSVFCILSITEQSFGQSGSLNISFGTGGITTTDLGSFSIGKSVAMQNDGKTVVAGYINLNDSTANFVLVRYDTNGSLDSTFNGNGKVLTAFGNKKDMAHSVAIQSDGKIVVAGSTTKNDTVWGYGYSNSDMALARYNSDGALDTTFSYDGKVTTILGSWSEATSVAIQTDGKILIAGYSNLADFEFVVVRYHTNGALDSTFDSDGIINTAFTYGSVYANDLIVQSDGKILVTGNRGSGLGSSLGLVRYNSNGSLDNSFGSGGSLITSIGVSNYGCSVRQQTDGKIVVGGVSISGYYTYSEFSLVRYDANGNLDTTFGTNGIVGTSITTYDDEGYSVAIQSDGKILLAGDGFNGESYVDFSLARYNTNGTLDNTFGTSGKVVTAIGNNADIAYSMVLQSDNKIVVAGFSSNGTYNNFAVARYNNVVTVAIKENTEMNDLNVYPNPTSGILFWNFNGISMDSKICIHDALGNCILDEVVIKSNNQVIDLNRQPKGIYFLEIMTDNGRLVKKIILQ